jgi:CheY-specific phosphatase CheX
MDVVPQAVNDIFTSMCGVDIQPTEDENLSEDGVIIAVISLVGDVDWTVFIGLPRSTATEIAKTFAGFEIPYDSPDMGDAIGELTNIIAGQAKAILDSRGLASEISLPSVIRASNLQVLVQKNSAGQKICYESQIGKMWTGVISGDTPGFVA